MNNVSGEELSVIANAIAILVTQDRKSGEIYVISGMLLAIAASMNLIANQRELLRGNSSSEGSAI